MHEEVQAVYGADGKATELASAAVSTKLAGLNGGRVRLPTAASSRHDGRHGTIVAMLILSEAPTCQLSDPTRPGNPRYPASNSP